MQGRAGDQRDMWDVESVPRHLFPEWSVFAFLAVHRQELFPAEMFADLFPSRRGRPSIPADVKASVIVLQTLHGLSDRGWQVSTSLRTDLALDALDMGLWLRRRRVRTWPS